MQELKTGLLPAPAWVLGSLVTDRHMLRASSRRAGALCNQQPQSFLGVPTGLSPSLLPSLNTRISYFLRLEGGREPSRMLVNMPASLPLALCRGNLASPLCQYIYYRETTGDHGIKFQSFESVFSQSCPGECCASHAQSSLCPGWHLLT